MFWDKWLKPRPAVVAGRSLYDSAVRQSRRPVFYSDWRVPDTRMGRFEVYTLHVVFLARRLKGQGPQAQETAQAVFDSYVDSLDVALREIGVGDLSMGKKMKKLGQAFYGRAGAYEAAQGDRPALEALINRVFYDGVEGANPAPLADYAETLDAWLARQETGALLEGAVTWPEAG